LLRSDAGSETIERADHRFSPRIRDALAFMRLSDAAGRLVNRYSGGMIRRLEIAQSTVPRPRVLFLDEPTVGLDPLGRKAGWQHILEPRDSHTTTIFFTTHLMEEADTVCGRVAIMHLGKVAAIGTPADRKASLGTTGAILDDVFIHCAGDTLESGGNYRAREPDSGRRDEPRFRRGTGTNVGAECGSPAPQGPGHRGTCGGRERAVRRDALPGRC
jgi:ABC-type multidrug transport system ATPase subunit